MKKYRTKDPFIWVKENAFSSEFCETLIRKFEECENKKPGITARGYEPDIKSSLDVFITGDPLFYQEDSFLHSSLTLLLLEYRNSLPYIPWRGPIADKGYSIQKTTPGEGYTWHGDQMVSLEPPFVRTVTFILYLNTVEKGGHTEFRNGVKVKPEEGKVLFFPAEFTYEHRGCTPKSGEKYICTGWFDEPVIPPTFTRDAPPLS